MKRVSVAGTYREDREDVCRPRHGWEIECPDGRVRHYPYTNLADAEFDARLCDDRGCRLFAQPNELEKSLPPCPGGAHGVRPCAAPRLTDDVN